MSINIIAFLTILASGRVALSLVLGYYKSNIKDGVKL
jgi:hypothetical protein